VTPSRDTQPEADLEAHEREHREQDEDAPDRDAIEQIQVHRPAFFFVPPALRLGRVPPE
jgi:hypothetical protein